LKWEPDSDRLRQYLESFRGTPHVPRRAKPGRGVDCIQLVLGGLHAAGACPKLTIPQYDQIYGHGTGLNPMAAAFLATFHADLIEPLYWAPKDADVVIFATGLYSAHSGIVLNGRFWHVTMTLPVRDCSLARNMRRIESVIRINRPGIKIEPSEIKTR
jgi:cell wall-associated NlpC family hydrolase